MTKIWRNMLFQGVGAELSKFGFRLAAREQQLVREVPIGQNFVHLSFIRHPGDFDVTVDVAIRVDAVECLLNEYRSDLTPRQKRGTCTMGAELGNMEVGFQRRSHVASDADVPNAVEDVVSAVRRVALPYFERFQTLEAIYSVLSDDVVGDDYMAFRGARCMRAVALASVMKRDDIWELVERERAFLAEKRDFALSAFERVAHAIAKH